MFAAIRRLSIKPVITLVVVLSLPLVLARGDHIAPEYFLAEVFAEQLPASDTVWISGEKKAAVEAILGHKADYLRLRYWGDEQRSAWIVDEIGKTEPITIGVVINGDEIEEVKVLAFRESRGWEIKHNFFTQQFQGAQLATSARLDRSIDGISGATLSVRAMTNVSRLVLYLAKSLHT